MVESKKRKRAKKVQIKEDTVAEKNIKASDEGKKRKRDEDNEDNVSDQEDRSTWSKSKKKRMRKLRAKMKKNVSEEPIANSQRHEKPRVNASDETADSNTFKSKEKDTSNQNIVGEEAPSTESSNDNKKKGGSTLQQSYAARLSGSRFRILNEELYTTTSSSAFENFQSNPELFDQYHEGFRRQVESWPSNPVDAMFNWLNKKYSTSSKTTVVADFGCGDAELAKRLLKVSTSASTKKKNKTKKKAAKEEKKSSGDQQPFLVHSFDLVARSELVTACDMANVPLKDKSVDVAVFCLALMGSNVTDFLLEAHRVLKDNGKVKIAEVRSRFESSKGKDELDDFVTKLKRLGFDCGKVDRSNKMFVMMELKKNGTKPEKKIDVKIKPCIYKRR